MLSTKFTEHELSSGVLHTLNLILTSLLKEMYLEYCPYFVRKMMRMRELFLKANIL